MSPVPLFAPAFSHRKPHKTRIHTHAHTKPSPEMSPQSSTTLSHKTDSHSPRNCMFVVDRGGGLIVSRCKCVCVRVCKELENKYFAFQRWLILSVFVHRNTPPEIWIPCLSGVGKLTQSAHLLACPLCLVVKDCASAVENADDLHTQDQTAEPLCQGKALSKRFEACVCAWWRQTEHSWSTEEETRGQEEVRELLVVMVLVFGWGSITDTADRRTDSLSVSLTGSL